MCHFVQQEDAAGSGSAAHVSSTAHLHLSPFNVLTFTGKLRLTVLATVLLKV